MRTRAPFLAALLIAALALGAGATAVRVDNWETYAPGTLDLAGVWRPYPSEQKFKHAPAIVLDGTRPALSLKTENEAMRIGRTVKVDLRETPWLAWEWKAVVLPEGGDVRDQRRNDQAGRVMVMFEGLKSLLYVWDTTAPVGAESRSDGFEIYQRVLIVVRSGADSVGQWDRQRRNVYEDYRRVFNATRARSSLSASRVTRTTRARAPRCCSAAFASSPADYAARSASFLARASARSVSLTYCSGSRSNRSLHASEQK